MQALADRPATSVERQQIMAPASTSRRGPRCRACAAPALVDVFGRLLTLSRSCDFPSADFGYRVAFSRAERPSLPSPSHKKCERWSAEKAPPLDPVSRTGARLRGAASPFRRSTCGDLCPRARVSWFQSGLCLGLAPVRLIACRVWSARRNLGTVIQSSQAPRERP